MPKKGSRSIVVDDVPYRFKIGGCGGYLQVAVKAVAEGNLTTLLVNTSVRPPVDIWLLINEPEEFAEALAKRPVYVTTAAVEAYIRQALTEGWNPTTKGKPFLFVADAAMATGKT